ncbi:uncharacterized protein [Littorina saxatilis]|uniref:uncharacterized protein n=1 Tax=Littorina saxatilis TaxID=31220 RepID=UPI0038B53DB6
MATPEKGSAVIVKDLTRKSTSIEQLSANTVDNDVTYAESSSAVSQAASSHGTDVGISTDSVEKVKDSDRRRSKSGKRRSGFSRGRVSLTQLSKDAPRAGNGSSGGDIYKQIPADLSSAQRLSLLSRLALRHTLEVLDGEFEDVPGFDSFKAEALESVGATIDRMEGDGTFEQACSTPSLAPNPLNLQMDTTIAELKRSINRVQQEDSSWDDLVKKLETQAQQAEQQLSQLDLPHDSIADDIRELSRSFLPPSAQMPDLAAVGLEAVKDVKTISLLMNDYCHSVELLNSASYAARKHMDHLTETLDVSGCRGQDPKEQIQELLAS